MSDCLIIELIRLIFIAISLIIKMTRTVCWSLSVARFLSQHDVFLSSRVFSKNIFLSLCRTTPNSRSRHFGSID